MYKLTYKVTKTSPTKELYFNDLGDAYTELNKLGVKKVYSTLLREGDTVYSEYNADNVRGWWADELKDVTYITVVGIHKSTNRNWDAGIWNHFALLYPKNGEVRQINARELYQANAPHAGKLSKEGYYGFMSSVLGMDRPFEIVYNLSQWLYGDGYRLKPEFKHYN